MNTRIQHARNRKSVTKACSSVLSAAAFLAACAEPTSAPAPAEAAQAARPSLAVAPSARQTKCMPTVTAGYLVEDRAYSPTCGYNPLAHPNQNRLRYYADAKVGETRELCAGEQPPAGWEIIKSYTGLVRCGARAPITIAYHVIKRRK